MAQKIRRPNVCGVVKVNTANLQSFIVICIAGECYFASHFLSIWTENSIYLQ